MFLFGLRKSEACSCTEEECPWKHSALHLPEYTGAEPALIHETGSGFVDLLRVEEINATIERVIKD